MRHCCWHILIFEMLVLTSCRVFSSQILIHCTLHGWQAHCTLEPHTAFFVLSEATAVKSMHNSLYIPIAQNFGSKKYWKWVHLEFDWDQMKFLQPLWKIFMFVQAKAFRFSRSLQAQVFIWCFCHRNKVAAPCCCQLVIYWSHCSLMYSTCTYCFFLLFDCMLLCCHSCLYIMLNSSFHIWH